MKASELQGKSKAELNENLLLLLKEQFNLRMQAGMGEAPRSHLFGKVRKSIARIKTILNNQA
ncbi:MAG: 50S ribosomal protein L29 [Gammaproteobacteria bacterium RIFCSPHIGHO2_12_FULL_38_14]|nr:MAG: 50S ribosomal protein L29 [Gammaproteobacteria bacterium RIFCSPHIGHO2_12_FULL_38_14]